MLAIRLARVGAKKQAAYRVVVMEKSRARDSRSVEILGHYNPRQNPTASEPEDTPIGVEDLFTTV
jgi:small subunit ribosomal protein S16